ncbi:MAG: thiamine-phosphate kinase [Terriglobia bacterium]|nr:thiamine-phosphate kinase [Terriglobia bacterium]
MPLSELQLIAKIRRQAKTGTRAAGARITKTIGDDCAVLEIAAGNETLVTTDFSLEGIHFRRDLHSAHVVGHRCLARGLSDIAAMGGEPTAAFLSLALPEDLPQKWVDEFLDGFLGLAREFGVTLAGGDIAQSPGGVLADIMVVGTLPRGEAIMRSGAKPGDHLYITGELGAASAMLERMFANPKKRYRASDSPAHFVPQPQIKIGRYLRDKKIASAMIDISDGLSTDLTHLCDESGVRAEVQEEAIPVASIGKHEVSLENALHGGDEYQLLFTAPPNKRVPAEIAGVPISQIGYIEAPQKHLPKILLFEGNDAELGVELRPKGWEHFSEGKGQREKGRAKTKRI